MKRIYIAIIFVLTCIALCVYEQITLNDFYTKMSESIDNASYKINSNENSNSEIEIVKQNYKKFENKIKIICDENYALELSNAINEFGNLEYKEKNKALTEMRALVDYIYNRQRLNWSNVF